MNESRKYPWRYTVKSDATNAKARRWIRNRKNSSYTACIFRSSSNIIAPIFESELLAKSILHTIPYYLKIINISKLLYYFTIIISILLFQRNRVFKILSQGFNRLPLISACFFNILNIKYYAIETREKKPCKFKLHSKLFAKNNLMSIFKFYIILRYSLFTLADN